MVDGNRLGFLSERHHKYQWKIYSKKKTIAVKLTEDCTSVALEPANSHLDAAGSASVYDVLPIVSGF